MYGNNFGYPFVNNMPINSYMMPNRMIPPRGISSLFKFTSRNPMSTGFNFSKLLNGASRTLGIVKEAIPIGREVRPMMHNMRSMLKIASVFKDETDTKKEKSNIKKEETPIQNNEQFVSKENYNYNNSPNFFL